MEETSTVDKRDHGYSTYCQKCITPCGKGGGNYYFCRTDKWTYKSTDYYWDYCSPSVEVEYYGNKCTTPCHFNTREYQWCNTRESWGYCSTQGSSCRTAAREQDQDHGYSTYCQKCITPCTNEGSNYYFCRTRPWMFNSTEYSWDVCSPASDIESHGNKCITPCRFGSKEYQSCNTNTKDDSWGYCSTKGSSCREQDHGYSTYCQKCITPCTNEGSIYYFCRTKPWMFNSTEYSWDVCSPSSDIESHGKRCITPCHFSSKEYQWCHTNTKDDSWGYCSTKGSSCRTVDRRDYGYSTYCQKCITPCQMDGITKYYVCRTNEWTLNSTVYSWDYCSQSSDVDYYENKCTGPCHFDSKGYQLCNTKHSGGYCSTPGSSCRLAERPQPPLNYGYSSYCQECISSCDKDPIKNYYRCRTNEWTLNATVVGWDNCSPSSDVEHHGNKCTNPCDYYGKPFQWCYTTEAWGYCSRPESVCRKSPPTKKFRWVISHLTGAPDGVTVNHILGINGNFPGPPIHANAGDLIQVEVVNQIKVGEHVTLHWHGIHQRGTPFEDGNSQITQCGLSPGSKQEYSFLVPNSGTYWYHSHVNSQYTEGLWGPLIVHNDKELYSYDQEFTITLNDWYHFPAKKNEQWYLSSSSQGEPPHPSSVLMNGIGRFPCNYAQLQGFNCTRDLQARPIFKIPNNKTTRLRLINTSGWTPFNFTIDGHRLQVIEADGVDVAPSGGLHLIDAVYIGPAQRYSFILHRKEPVSANATFIVRAYTRAEFLFDNPDVTNINIYPQAVRELNPLTGIIEYVSNTSLVKGDGHGKLFDKIEISSELFAHNETVAEAIVPIGTLDFLDEATLRPQNGIKAPEKIDKEVLLSVKFVKTEDGIHHATFNGTPFELPTGKPLLMRVLDNEILPKAYNTIFLEYNSVVQVIINNPADGPHPLHLHGHHFWVVGMGRTDDGNFNSSVHPLNLSAMQRDTVMVKQRSFLVIRFIADNPGVWAFHCHIDWHNLSGMNVNFVEAAKIARETTFVSRQAIQTCFGH